MTNNWSYFVDLSLGDVYDLSLQALQASGVIVPSAQSVALSLKKAEADGMHSHGLMRLPAYCRHARSGKVRGDATPVLTARSGAVLQVDACEGFAHPAIDMGLPGLVDLARQLGIALLGVRNAYHAGAMGYHVERLAEAGLVGLAFANAPASIAPWGAATAVFGTNPIAFSAPGVDGPALIIDQACSVIARGEVVLRAKAGQSLEDGIALDAEGTPTTDPCKALEGTMLPYGGLKGVNIAWIVEVLAALLTGSSQSREAPSVVDDAGGSPRLGQVFIAIKPESFNSEFQTQLMQACEHVKSLPGARLPGQGRGAARRRTKSKGVSISRSLYDEIRTFIKS